MMNILLLLEESDKSPRVVGNDLDAFPSIPHEAFVIADLILYKDAIKDTIMDYPTSK